MQQNMSNQCDSSWPWQGTWGDYSSSPGSQHKTLAGRVEHLRLSGVCPYTPEPVDSSWEHVSLLFLCHECNFWTKKDQKFGLKSFFKHCALALYFRWAAEVHYSHYWLFCDKSHLCLQWTWGLEQQRTLQSESVWKKNISTYKQTNKQTDQNRKNIYFSRSRYSNKPWTGWVSSAENQTQLQSS